MAWSLLAVLLSATGAFSNDVLVGRGDVLRIEVADAPDFSREVAVDANGAIALPQVGTVPVAGMDLEAVRTLIADTLSDLSLIRDPRVLVEFATYRPIYVGGAVEAPGAIAFVPGLTGRQAVIAAGGIRAASAADDAAPDAILAAFAARRATALAFGQVVARIARIEAELAGAEELARLDETAAPVSRDTLHELARAEADILSERRAGRAATEAHHDRLQKLVELEIETLERQAELQAEDADQQRAEIEAARSLVDKGLIPRPRFQEMLRDQSALTRTRLDTDAFAARARQTAETLRYELQSNDLLERENLRVALQTAIRERAALEAELEKLELRILAGAIAEPDAVDPPSLRLHVHRQSGDFTRRIEADLDAPVRPGDILEIVLVPRGPSARPMQ